MSKADWWNPRKPGGVRLVHLIILLVLAIAAVIVAYNIAQQNGYHAGKTDALRAFKARIEKRAYWLKYQDPLLVPKGRAPIFTAPGAPAQGTSAYISLRQLPDVTDQGQTGSCQCQAAAYYQGTWLWRLIHPNQWWKFSAGYCYDYVTNGLDVGSNLPEDVAFWGPNGIARYKYEPAQGYKPKPVVAGIPVVHFPVAYDTLFEGLGAGQGGVDAIRSYLAAGRIVNVGTADFANTMHSANQNGGNVGAPRPDQVSALFANRYDASLLGGHAFTCVGFDDNHTFYNPNTNQTETGALFCVNSWGKYYGLNRQGQAQFGNGGYFWYTYAAVRQVAFSVYSLKAKTTTGTQSYKGSSKIPPEGPRLPHKLYSLKDYVQSLKTAAAKHEPKAQLALKSASTPTRPGLTPRSSSAWYVQHVYATMADGSIRDVAPYINAASDAAYREHGWRVWPIGMAAVTAIESGLHEIADRYGPWCDVSFGPWQFTVCTVVEYGVGDGSGSAYNVANVRAFESSYVRMTPKAALLLGRYAAESCTSFPNTYISYNAGSGAGCGSALYVTPCAYNAVACRAYASYLVWFNYALTHWGYTGSTPSYIKPVVSQRAPVFRLKRWYAYRVGHHLPVRCCSPWAAKGGKLTWAASVWRSYQGLKGIKYAEQHHRRGKYTEDVFAQGRILMWARFHAVKVIGADKHVLYAGRWPR